MQSATTTESAAFSFNSCHCSKTIQVRKVRNKAYKYYLSPKLAAILCPCDVLTIYNKALQFNNLKTVNSIFFIKSAKQEVESDCEIKFKDKQIPNDG